MKISFMIIQLIIAFAFQAAFAASPSDCIPENKISAEEAELGGRFIDNIVSIKLKFGTQQYTLSRKGEFGKSGKKLQLSTAFKKALTKDQAYSSFMFEGLGLIDAGSDTFEGHISSVYVVGLEKGKIFSSFGKCANHDDGYYQKGKNFYYFCDFHCPKVYKLDPKAKKFTAVSGKAICKNIKSFKKITFNKASFSRTKGPDGKEYKTSFFPIKICK